MKQRLLVAAIGVPLLLAVLLLAPAWATALLAAALAAVGRDSAAGEPAPAPAWRPRPTVPEASRPKLSDGERQALVLYADGRTTSEVARAMNVQYETAKTYLRRVREKYGKVGRPTSSRADLIRRAAEDGYLT